jgi:hypothetical protein
MNGRGDVPQANSKTKFRPDPNQASRKDRRYQTQGECTWQAT